MKKDYKDKINYLKAIKKLTLSLLIICFIMTLMLMQVRIERSYYHIQDYYSIQENDTIVYDRPEHELFETEEHLWIVKKDNNNKTFFGLNQSFLYEKGNIRLENDYSTFIINDENIEKLFKDIIENSHYKDINTKDIKSKITNKQESDISEYIFKDGNYEIRVNLLENFNKENNIGIEISFEIIERHEYVNIINYIILFNIIFGSIMIYMYSNTSAIITEETNRKPKYQTIKGEKTLIDDGRYSKERKKEYLKENLAICIIPIILSGIFLHLIVTKWFISEILNFINMIQ